MQIKFIKRSGRVVKFNINIRINMTDMIFEKTLEISASQAHSIPVVVGDWWKTISKEVSSPASPGKLYAVGNYLIELVRNSLSDGKSNGQVTAIFDDEKIKIVIDDKGTDEKEINLNVGGDYGMKEAIEYFDVFTIESKGKFYEKDRRNHIEETDESDVYAGSKVTLIKYHVTPVEEEEESWQSNRNFGQRM
jgi:hypothetical protein